MNSKDVGRTSANASTAEDDGSSSYSKRATLIFLASLGASLLITGATGSRMLKGANAKASTPHASSSATPKRSSSKLKDLFAITAAESSASTSSPASTSKLDFRANQHSSFIRKVPLPGKAVNMAEAPSVTNPAVATAQAEDPALGAIIDAVKAFGIATFLIFGGTGLGGYLLSRKLGATDFESFMVSFRHDLMHPLAKRIEPNLPEWLRQRQRDPQEIANDKVEEEELRTTLKQEWRDFLHETNQDVGSAEALLDGEKEG